MFCPKCGNQLPDGSAFCSKCGAKLGDRAAAAPAGTVPPASRAAAPVPVPAAGNAYSRAAGAAHYAARAKTAPVAPAGMGTAVVGKLDGYRLVILACIIVAIIAGFFMPVFRVDSSYVTASQWGSGFVGGLNSLAGNDVDASVLTFRDTYTTLDVADYVSAYGAWDGDSSYQEVAMMVRAFAYGTLALMVIGAVWLVLKGKSLPAEIGCSLLAIMAAIPLFVPSGKIGDGLYANPGPVMVALICGLVAALLLGFARQKRMYEFISSKLKR